MDNIANGVDTDRVDCVKLRRESCALEVVEAGSRAVVVVGEDEGGADKLVAMAIVADMNNMPEVEETSILSVLEALSLLREYDPV